MRPVWVFLIGCGVGVFFGMVLVAFLGLVLRRISDLQARAVLGIRKI